MFVCVCVCVCVQTLVADSTYVRMFVCAEIQCSACVLCSAFSPSPHYTMQLPLPLLWPHRPLTIIKVNKDQVHEPVGMLVPDSGLQAPVTN